MKTNCPTKWFTAFVLFSCWLALADPGARAQDNVGAKDKIKELQKQRLEVAKKARDYMTLLYHRGGYQRALIPTASCFGCSN